MKHVFENIRLYGAFVGLTCMAPLVPAQKAVRGLGKEILEQQSKKYKPRLPSLSTRLGMSSKPGQFSPYEPIDLNSHNPLLSQKIVGESPLERLIRLVRGGFVKPSKAALAELQNDPHAKFKLTVNRTGPKLPKGKAIIPEYGSPIQQTEIPKSVPKPSNKAKASIPKTNNTLANPRPSQLMPKESPSTLVVRGNPPSVPYQETSLLQKELIQKENQNKFVKAMQEMFQSGQRSGQITFQNPQTGRPYESYILRENGNTVSVWVDGVKVWEALLEQENNQYRLWLKTPNGIQKMAEGQTRASQQKVLQRQSAIPKSSPELGKPAINYLHPSLPPPQEQQPHIPETPKSWKPAWPKSKIPPSEADTDIPKEDKKDKKTPQQQKKDAEKPQVANNNKALKPKIIKNNKAPEQQQPQQLTNDIAEQDQPENPANDDNTFLDSPHDQNPTVQHKDNPFEGTTAGSTSTSASPLAPSSAPANVHTPYNPGSASDTGSHPNYGIPHGISPRENPGVSIISSNHSVGNATPPEHASDAGTIFYPFPIPQATEQQTKDGSTTEPISEQLPTFSPITFELPTVPVIEQHAKPSSLGSVLHQQGSPFAITLLKAVMLLLHCICLAVGTLTTGWADTVSRVLRKLRRA
jgi:hypothetical protein